MHLLLVGHGYLGRGIERVFRDGGWSVVATSLSGGDGAMVCDVSDVVSVGRLREEVVPDFIIHCASSGRGGPDAYQRVYVDGCANLVRIFPGVRLVFTSSTSVYGQTDGSVVTEESEAKPERETGRLLLEAEGHVLRAGGVVARLAGIYGPGRSVILRKFLAGEARIEDDGSRFLNQIHRDDAARALLNIAMVGSRGIFNVCDDHPLTQKECYEALCRLFDRPLPPVVPRDLSRKRGWTHKRVTNARLRGIGWRPEFPSFLDAAWEIAQGEC